MYINSIYYSYLNGKLTELQTQSLISLIPKPGKDNSFLENWRPINLLNVDNKIATKAIANRVKKVLPKQIHNSQTGFMKGRYIGENIRQIFEVLEHAEEQEIPGLIFFTYFEKAFDSVDHDFWNRCFRHFNFGDSFINWIKLFYSNAKSCVSNNGHHSDFFPIQRGVRQGCPLSPYLFIIAIELLTFHFFSVAIDPILFNLEKTRRKCIISWMSSNFGQIEPQKTELAALERLKYPH